MTFDSIADSWNQYYYCLFLWHLDGSFFAKLHSLRKDFYFNRISYLWSSIACTWSCLFLLKFGNSTLVNGTLRSDWLNWMQFPAVRDLPLSPAHIMHLNFSLQNKDKTILVLLLYITTISKWFIQKNLNLWLSPHFWLFSKFFIADVFFLIFFDRRA